MIALYIIGGIFVFFFLLMFVRLSVMASYLEDDLQVKLKILFIKLTIYPFKEEKKVEKHKVVKKEPSKPKKEPKPVPPINETLLLLKDFVIEVVGKFGKYIKLEEYRIKLLVATEDPARTGVLYGLVSGILANISVFIERIKRRTKKKGRIFTEVKPDFISEKPEIFISVALSMRLWQFFSVGITASKGFLKYNSLRKAEDKKPQTLKTK